MLRITNITKAAAQNFRWYVENMRPYSGSKV